MAPIKQHAGKIGGTGLVGIVIVLAQQLVSLHEELGHERARIVELQERIIDLKEELGRKRLELDAQKPGVR